MPLRVSERTSNSKALSTICRFVLRRVSFRALRIKASSMSILVLLMETGYTIHHFCNNLCMPRDLPKTGTPRVITVDIVADLCSRYGLECIVGSTMTVQAAERAKFEPYDAIIPEVNGSVFISGHHWWSPCGSRGWWPDGNHDPSQGRFSHQTRARD